MTIYTYSDLRLKSFSLPLSAAFVAVALWLYHTDYFSSLRASSSQPVNHDAAAPSGLQRHTNTPSIKRDPQTEVSSDSTPHDGSGGQIPTRTAQFVDNGVDEDAPSNKVARGSAIRGVDIGTS